MISVLMSIYNRDNPAWLKEALDSIFNQTLRPTEVVIVQDGPINAQLENVLNTYDQTLIKTIKLSTNVGQEVALKTGLEQCSCEYVARMDSDDICPLDRFEIQLEEFKKDPSISVLSGYIKEFAITIDDLKLIRTVPLTHEEIYSYAKWRSPVNHAAVMFRKSAVLAVGNYGNFLWNEDYHLWVRLLTNGYKFKNIPKVLLYARGGKSMYTRRGGFQYLKQDLKLYSKFYQLGFLTFDEMLINLIIRLPVRIAPNFLREIFYVKFLRKKPS